jgi:hypothetical protein
VGTSVTYNNDKITFIIPNALAGSKVNLNTGTSATNLYDLPGNGSSSVATIFNGSGWQIDSSFLTIGTSFLPDLFVSGVFVTTPGGTPGQSLIVNNTDGLLISIGDTSSTSSVNIPDNTDISELNNGEFDASLIQLTNIDPTTISNLGSDYTPQTAIQWGIVGTTLKFNHSITINIYVGLSLEGQILYVFRSSSLSSGWTSDGIDSPVTCTVTSGFCQFTATLASYYTAASSLSSPTPTPTTAPANNSSPYTFTIDHNPPSCNDVSPIQAPDLFAIKTSLKANKGSAQLIFTPVVGQITGYAVIYGFKKGDERFGAIFNSVNNNQGEQNYTVSNLNPKLTYYFEVAALNGCTSSPWSTWLPAKANRKAAVYKYRIAPSGKVSKLVENVFK